jgi:hypothetical protein
MSRFQQEERGIDERIHVMGDRAFPRLDRPAPNPRPKLMCMQRVGRTFLSVRQDALVRANQDGQRMSVLRWYAA